MSFLSKLPGPAGRLWRSQLTKLKMPENASKVYSNFSDFDLPNLKIHLIGDPPMDIMSVTGALHEQYSELFIKSEIKGFHYLKMLEDGILKIPVVLNIDHQAYALFFIYDEKGASRFHDAKIKLKNTEFPNALYLSTFDISAIAKRQNALQVLSISDLIYQEQAISKGAYGMWWKTKNESLFCSSKTKKYLGDIYESVAGYESYFLGYFLSEMKIKGFEKFRRVALPKEQKEILVKGPENKNLVFSCSQNKGIGIHFPMENCDLHYRELFLEQFRNALQAFKLTLQLREVPKDQSGISNGLEWYNFMNQVMKEQEKKGILAEVIGGVHLS